MIRKKRKKTKRLSCMSVICITTMSVLNLLGVSYAYWNDELEVVTSISTGKIEPYFIRDNKLVGNDRGEILDIDITDNIITINCQVSSKYNDNLFINIGNRGTLPIEYKELKVIEKNEIIKEIELQEGETIDKIDEKQVRIQLHANNKENKKNKGEKNENEAEHKFKYELVFVQKK